MFAALCVVVSGLGHSMMAGADVPLWAMGYAFACVTAVGWWLTGRERGALAVTGAAVLTQAVAHLVFTLGQMMPGLPTGYPSQGGDTPGMTGMTGMAAMPAPVRAPGPGADPPPGRGMVLHEWTLGMLATHVVVAVLCGLWLWRGEVAVHRLGRALASFLTAPLRRSRPTRPLPEPPPSAPASADDGHHVRWPGEASLRHSLVRRGPPYVRTLHRLAPV